MKRLYMIIALLICDFTMISSMAQASILPGYAAPTSVLSINIKTFTAYKKGKVVYLRLTINNQEVFNNYGVELSKNGKEYTNIGIARPVSAFHNSEISYEYEYQTQPGDAGKLFFRVQQIDKDNKSLYSEVRMVSVDQDGDAAYRPYPNPTVKGINILFDKMLEGTYDVILSDNAGKATFRKTYTLAGTNIISVQWPQKPLPGIYYLHTTDKQNNLYYNAKIIVN